MGSKKQTIGFHYLMSMLSGLWRGPINALTQIRVGDKDAWGGSVSTDAMQMIQAPELFGGEKKEGGVQGGFRVYMGQEDQVLPPTAPYGTLVGALGKDGPASSGTLMNPKTLIGGLVSDFRGVVTVWFDGLVCSMNPYPKEWKFRGWRTTSGWWQGADYPLAPNSGPKCWYGARATIELAEGSIKAMNPAHIIYQSVTDPNWGRGLPLSFLDHESFTYAADVLYDEGFGLCLTWHRSDGEDIEDFIKVVINHIGAALYTNRETGLLTLRLIRSDYEIDDLPHFDEDSGLLDIRADDGAAASQAYNEVILNGHSPIDDKDFQMRAQNTAAWQESQAANAMRADFKGIPTPDLLARVAGRELKVHASGLKKYKVTLDRHAWRIAPASCFRVSSSRRGIANIVLRAGEIEESSINDGRITISAVEDVFGLAATSYMEPVTSTWTPPDGTARPPVAEVLLEAGYRDVYLHSSQADAVAMLPNEGTVAQMAAATNVYQLEFDLQTKAAGEEYDTRANGVFTGTALLATAIDPLDTVLVLSNVREIAENNVGQALWLDNELLALMDIDVNTGTATVKRGCGDTVPTFHASGARLWTIDDDVVSDERSYVEGETVYSRVLTRTSSDRLPVTSATENSVVIVGRAARPYPPADLKVNGVSFFEFEGASGEPVTLTYASRNRLTQADVLVGHTEPSVVAEAGTDYVITIGLIGSTTAVRTVSTAELSWTYTDAMRLEDGNPSEVWMALSSRRDGLFSWQNYRFDVSLDYVSVPPYIPFAFDPDLTVLNDPDPGVGTDVSLNGLSGNSFSLLYHKSAGANAAGTYGGFALAPVAGAYDLTFTTNRDNYQAYVLCCTDPASPLTSSTASYHRIHGPGIVGGVGPVTDRMAFDTTTLNPMGGTHWFLVCTPGGMVLSDGDPDLIASISVTEA